MGEDGTSLREGDTVRTGPDGRASIEYFDGSLTRRRRGAGVGLYLAREIVRLHHGTIEVESRPGEGSVFHVRLPGPLVAGPIPHARV